MQKRYQHLTNPATIISFIVAVFWFGITWWTLNNRINHLEEFQSTINMVEIQSTLATIQSDINWIKLSLTQLQK